MALRPAFAVIEAAKTRRRVVCRMAQFPAETGVALNGEPGIDLLSTVISHVISEWLPLPLHPIRLIKRPKQPPHRTRRWPQSLVASSGL
jgi:hypothetical protein